MKITLHRLTKKEAGKNYDVSDRSDFKEYPIFRLKTDHAFLDFDSYKGELKGASVLNVETEKKFRNQGRATALIKNFIKRFGYAHIHWGAFTPDGEKFLQHLTKI